MLEVNQSVKILHFGNVFLDCPFTDLEAETSRLYREQKRQTFRRAVEWARDNGVDIVLITGDLVDNSYATLDTLRFVRETFRLAPHCRFVITPGAHDFIWSGSIYRMGTFPDNVTIFQSESPTRVEFPDIHTVVAGWGFLSENDPGAPLRGRRTPNYDGVVLVAGYGAKGPDGVPAPIVPEDIAVFGGDYVALTGPNMHTGFHKVAGRTVYAYSGALEHSGYGEPGVGGANLITITQKEEERILGSERIFFGSTLFATEEIEVSGVKDESDILARIRFVMSERGYDSATALRVIFTGDLPVGLKLPTPQMASELGLYALSPQDKTLPACDESVLSRDMSVLGVVSRRLIPDMKQENPEARLPAGDAMRLAMETLKSE